LAKNLNIPYQRDLVIRSKNTQAQKLLSDKERIENTKNAFSTSENTRKYDIINKRIMIVDDIYTTGSTIDSMAKVLIASGAKEVYGLCIAIGRGFS
jgi:predicted amidophosphoribosyltransferase